MNTIYIPKGKAKEYGDYALNIYQGCSNNYPSREDIIRCELGHTEMICDYIVYAHVFPNGKIYIGISSKTFLNERWRSGKGYQNNKHLYSAIKKHGWENVKHLEKYVGLTEREAKQREIELIAKYRTTNPLFGYNITRGGEGGNGRKLTDEQKKAIGERFSKANKGKKLTDEHKAKIKAGMKWTKPVHITNEQIVQSNKTRTISEETRRRISENTKKGMLQSEKWKSLQTKRGIE